MAADYKILVTAKFDDTNIAYLQGKYDVTYKPGISYEELARLVSDFDILMISTSAVRIDRDLLAKTNRLKIIFRLGIGVDHIDLAVCREKRIKVAITPTANIQPVVELLFSRLISVLRLLDKAEENVERNIFRKSLPAGQEIGERVLGIIGVGRVGGAVARAASFFNCKVVCYDPYLAAYKKKKIKAHWVRDIRELLKMSNIVTLHVPLIEETRHMVNGDFLSLMKKGSILINYARGGVVSFLDVVKAVKEGVVSTYIADVFEEEPEIPRKPASLEGRFFFTPHIGAYTSASIAKRCTESASQLEDFIEGRKVPGLVDLKKGY